MTTDTLNGFYGWDHLTQKGHPCEVFTYATNGGHWYAVAGSDNANFTYDALFDGVDVEQLEDSDTFTVWGGIDSPESLQFHAD